jgi:TRAP-type uncharacterized transport system fused permease subunit
VVRLENFALNVAYPNWSAPPTDNALVRQAMLGTLVVRTATKVRLLVGLVASSTRPSLKGLWVAVVQTGQTVASIVVLTAVAGVVIGVIQLSGLGFSMSSILLALAGDHVILMLLMTGLVCVILGMALPTAVIYTMLAVLVAPALVQLGVDRLAAHLFIFYMGMLSMITPPVCFATFTAASIAGSRFWPTALSGMRYGVAAYILPFVFPFSPGLLMAGTPVEVVVAFVTAAIGVSAIGAGLVGYLFRPINYISRALLVVCGIAGMVSPFESYTMLMANVLGLGGLVLIVGGYWALERRSRPGAAPGLRAGE